MFNWFNKLISKTLMSSPSVSYIKPKSINVFFKKGKNQKFTYIDLSDCHTVDFEVIKEIKDNDNEYVLLLNKDKLTIEIDAFESRQDAENALLELRVKLFSVEKALIKFTIMATILIFVWGVLADIVSVSITNLKTSVQSSQQQQLSMTPDQQITPDVAALLAEQQNRLAALSANGGQSPQAQQPTIVQPTNPTVNDFMQGLKK